MSRYASRFLAALCLIVLAAAAAAQQTSPPASPPAAAPGAAIDPKAKQDVLDQLHDVIMKRAFVPGVDFSKWPTFLDAHRTELDKAETDVVFARELNKVLKQFGVSHINLRTPRAATQRQSGTTSGLGMIVKKAEGGLEVTNVFPMGPAGEAGIQVGDVIKEIEGKPAEDPGAIRVELGQKVAIKLAKKTGETKDLTLENKEFSNRRPETLTWLGDDAAVLKIYTFANGYDRKNVESLIQQVDAKAKYLIIDLRSNGGGAVANLNHFLSMLMPDQTPVGVFVGRNVVDEYAKTHTDGLNDPVAIAAWNVRKFKTNKREGVEPFGGKIAVLINRGSASASEICSAALKDCRDAVLVGQKSLGAVLASVYGRLPGGFELQYPVQDYVTIKGERLEGHPREPDLVVERSANGEDDAPAKALDLLKKRSEEHSSSKVSTTGHKQAA